MAGRAEAVFAPPDPVCEAKRGTNKKMSYLDKMKVTKFHSQKY